MGWYMPAAESLSFCQSSLIGRSFLMQSMRTRYQLPVGAIVHPLADPQDVPVIGLDHGGIVRCKRCRTYINPFVRWSDGGR